MFAAGQLFRRLRSLSHADECPRKEPEPERSGRLINPYDDNLTAGISLNWDMARPRAEGIGGCRHLENTMKAILRESNRGRVRTVKADVKDDLTVRRSSGNIFADLRLPNAAESQTKLKLAVALNGVLDRAGLSQVEAAKRLSVNQPKISALRNYKLEGFSVERLIAFMTALNCDVDIVIRSKSRSSHPGRVSVRAA